MKKLFLLLLLPLLLLTACSNKEGSKSLSCSYEKDGDYSTVEWTELETVKVTAYSYDSEEIAEQKEEEFETDETITSIQRDGKIILIVRVTENKDSESIDSVKRSYEKDGYKCEIEDAK